MSMSISMSSMTTRLYICLALLGLVFGIAYFDAAALLLDRWNNRYDYSHGYLVVPMAFWLGWTSLVSSKDKLSIKPSIVGLLCLAVVVVLYTGLSVINLTIGMLVLMPIVLVGLSYALVGLSITRKLITAIGFLYFAIPIWDLTIPILQSMAVFVASHAVDALDIVTFFEGSLIRTSAGSFEVNDSCAGQRFFTSALMLSSFFALTTYRSWTIRTGIVAAAAILALIANWIRIISLILIGHYTDMQHYLIMGEHYSFGWLIFAVVFVPFFFIASSWLTAERLNREHSVFVLDALPRHLLPYSLLISLVLALPLITSMVSFKSYDNAYFHLPNIPDWQDGELRTIWEPDILPPTYQTTGSYQYEGNTVHVWYALYDPQIQDSKVISTRNKIWGNHIILAKREKDTALGHKVQELELSLNNKRQLLWYWFDIGGQSTTDPRLAKIFEIYYVFLGRRDGAMTAFLSDCEISCDDTRQLLSNFAKNWP